MLGSGVNQVLWYSICSALHVFDLICHISFDVYIHVRLLMRGYIFICYCYEICCCRDF